LARLFARRGARTLATLKAPFSRDLAMLPWQETAMKIAASALLLAVVLPLVGFAFVRNGSSSLRALRVGAILLGVVALAAGAAALLGEVWR
jgi:hypothetical protein